MQRFWLLIFLLILFGCGHSEKNIDQRLTDTLNTLKKQLDFKPLGAQEAYRFINDYYLPLLDKTPTKRKIFIYPLQSLDLDEIYKYYEKNLKREYYENKLKNCENNCVLPPPPPTSSPPGYFDKNIKWDALRLSNTQIIADTNILIDNAKILRSLKAWRRVYGSGYMCISYPQYNPHTRRLLLKEYLENDDWCGTGHENTFWFAKSADGWQIVN